ncbi:MAG: prolyl aminopeptidase [Phycisphaerae bacterium]|nr:prolyl aminopeptidase [Phycisphaerae bacterium]
MRRWRLPFPVVVLLLSAMSALAAGPTSRPHRIEDPPPVPLLDYYPEIEPFKTGYLRVSDLHEIYYELCGNPSGRPVMLLHGGPGGGSYPDLRRFHDPTKYLLVLHDQRGAGKSRPHAELRENTTPNLVSDIERLRTHLKLGKVQVFGGSWGSTLALAYAEAYPQHIDSLVLRGIFTATKDEIDHFYHGPVATYFPEAHERLRQVIPNPSATDYPRQLYEQIRHRGTPRAKHVADEWARYETRVSRVGMTDAMAEKFLADWDSYDFSLIENYYMANRCFLEEEQLLRDAPRLTGISTIIVNGRYDVICPPINAFRVHRAIPGSKLVIVEDAGHGGGAPPMRSALIQAVRDIESMRRAGGK